MILNPGDKLYAISGVINTKVAKTGQDVKIKLNLDTPLRMIVAGDNKLLLSSGWYTSDKYYEGNDGRFKFKTLKELNNSSNYCWEIE